MKALVRWLLDLIYPPKCMLCRRLLESSDQILCPRCGFDLPEWEGPLRKVRYYEKAVAPFYYKGKVRDAILRFKFHGMQPYARQFARWMAVWVRDHLQGQFELITWVPCSRRRRWSRGFDQAQLLAKALGEELAVPVFRTLEKVKHNPKQSTSTPQGQCARRLSRCSAGALLRKTHSGGGRCPDHRFDAGGMWQGSPHGRVRRPGVCGNCRCRTGKGISR